AAGRRPALLWSAPTERSGDGALDLRTAMETPGPGALQNPKRRGASLPAALQKVDRDDFAERGSMSRSTLIATDALDLSKRWVAGKDAAGHRPALLWSAPTERSGDGALDLRTAMETTGPGALQNPKRRGASLPAALQNAGREYFAE